MTFSISDNKNLSLIWLFAVLILCTLFVQVRMQPISPVDSEQGRFSAVKAKALLSDVLGDETPHPVDSAANRGVQERIAKQLTHMGYDVEVQDEISCRKYGRYVCARVRNLITRLEGDNSSGSILLSAHYDSVAAAPGASDAGSAVATLLQIASMLKEKGAGNNDVVFLFNEGEEVGLLGANSFIEKHPLMNDVKVVINIEARGTSGQSILFETSNNNSWLIDLYSKSARRPTTNSLFYEIYKFLPNDTDLTLFKAAGLAGLNFAYAEKLSNYHTANDSLEKLDMGSLQHHGDNVYDVLLELMGIDFSKITAGEKVYTDMLGFGVISWSESVSPIVSFALVVLFIFASWRVKKATSYSIGGVGRGAATMLLSLFLATVVAYLLNMLMISINGFISPWKSNHLANWLVLWTTIFTIVSIVYGLMGRKNDTIGNFVGFWGIWSLLTLFVSLTAPGASYLFIIPLVISTLLFLIYPVIRQKYEKLALPLILSISSISSLLVLLPIVFYIEIMLGFVGFGPVAMGLALGLVFSSVAPIVMSIAKTFLNKLVILCLVIASVSTIFWSIEAPAYNDGRPHAINVYYIQNADEDYARVAVGSKSYPAQNEVYSAMGSNVELHRIFPWSNNMFYSSVVESSKLDKIDLKLVSQQDSESSRSVTFKIESESKSQQILFYIPKEAQLKSITYAGRTMPYSENKSGEFDQFNCLGESCIGKEISFELSNKEQTEVIVAKGVIDVPETVRHIKQARDKNGVAIHGGDESYIITKIKI